MTLHRAMCFVAPVVGFMALIILQPTLKCLVIRGQGSKCALRPQRQDFLVVVMGQIVDAPKSFLSQTPSACGGDLICV